MNLIGLLVAYTGALTLAALVRSLYWQPSYGDLLQPLEFWRTPLPFLIEGVFLRCVRFVAVRYFKLDGCMDGAITRSKPKSWTLVWHDLETAICGSAFFIVVFVLTMTEHISEIYQASLMLLGALFVHHAMDMYKGVNRFSVLQAVVVGVAVYVMHIAQP
jgi:hypothetical protein